MKNDQTQQKYLQLQMIDNQMQQAQQELQQIELKQKEVEALKDSLGELKDSKSNSKTFSPLGLGIYAQGTIKDTKELLVNVGAGVMVKKKVEVVRNVLDKQLQQFKIFGANLMQNMQMMAMQAQAIEKELSK